MLDLTHHPSRGRIDLRDILRNIVLFLVFLGGSAFILFFKGEFPSPEPERIEAGLGERFWQIKARSPRKANVLFIGDSRVNQGISPAAFISELPGANWTGRNLSFNGGGLNPEIFDFAESRLDLKSSRPPVIVMGISPGSLTLLSSRNEHFQKLKKRPLAHALAYIFFPKIVGSLSKAEIDMEIQLFPGQNEYHEDGWQAARRDFDLWPDAWIAGTERLFRIDSIRPEFREALLKRTQTWSEKGIIVIGFRVPTSPRLREIENVDGVFDELAFANDFIAHGGTWIPVDPNDYRTYDNSHLEKADATKLSMYLGRQTAALLKKTQLPGDPESATHGDTKPKVR